MTTTPPEFHPMQSSSVSNSQDETPVRFTDASSAPTGIGTMQLSPEDVIGLLGLRYAKCQIAPARPGHNWHMTLAVPRPGLPPRYWMEYLLGPNPDPFFLACKWPKPGANQIDFYHAYTWQVTYCEQLENPAYSHFGLRGSYPEKPLIAGKWVVLLWGNTGGTGWDPEGIDYLQRVVIELRDLPKKDD